MSVTITRNELYRFVESTRRTDRSPVTVVVLRDGDERLTVNPYQLERLLAHFGDFDLKEAVIEEWWAGDVGPGTYAYTADTDPDGPGAIRLAVSPLSEAPADAVLTLVAEGRTLPIRFRDCPACGRTVTVVERDATEVLSDGFEVADEALVIKPHDCAGRN